MKKMETKLLLKENTNVLSGQLRWSMKLFVCMLLLAGQNAQAQDASPDGGMLAGGPSFAFCVGDEEADHVSDVSVSSNTGANSQWVVTTPEGKILGLPPAPEAVNFDGAGAGTCLIWHLSYEDGLEGLEAGKYVADLSGTFDFSDAHIPVYRSRPDGGTLTGGPFEFMVDGEVDHVYGIAITGNRSGSNSTFVITSPEGEILGIPPSLAAVEGINFDGAGAGTCLIWHLRYEDGLTGLEMGMNTNNLSGCYDFSNYIEVVRKDAISGGMLAGGPSFEFCVGDEEADHVSGVTVTGNTGSNSQWVITSPEGKILGLPPAPEAVNFDGAGAGTCIIWHLSYEDGLEGLAKDNYVADLAGTYDFSDYISVYRSQPEAGELTGGPFEFMVDGEVDHVYGIAITGKRSGSNSTFVVTTPEGEILGIPPSLAAVEGINFDGAGAGTCLIWHLRYEDGLEGLEMGMNANEFSGCYDFSNYIEVVRTDAPMIYGGMLSGGPSFEFCVGDEEADHVSGVIVSGNTGANAQWVVTSPEGKILGLPPAPEAVNFDGAGAGTCLIWHLSYEDGLEGLEAGKYVADLSGTYDFSDYISVYRSQPEAGELTGGPFEFIVDGEIDNVYGIAITGERSGSNSTFVVTTPEGEILGIPPSLAAVEGINFDGAGAGTCLIWHLRYEDGLEGLEMGMNANDLNGCYDFSNAIEVLRAAATSGKSSVKLFPVPAEDILHLSLEDFGNRAVQVILVDLAGNAVKNNTEQIVDQSVSLDVQSVPSGLYILKVSNIEGKSVSKKVIIR